MSRAITKCPNCGSSVSQFAAGCAICGENLSAARPELERRREARPSLTTPAWVPQISASEAILGAILIIAAFGFPIVGGPVAGLFAYFGHRNGDVVQRNLALVAVAVAVIVLLVISFIPESSNLFSPWVNLGGPLPTN
jgi:peptidoglycan/LPS O-acetylase OafA/YrhL